MISNIDLELVRYCREQLMNKNGVGLCWGTTALSDRNVTKAVSGPSVLDPRMSSSLPSFFDGLCFKVSAPM